MNLRFHWFSRSFSRCLSEQNKMSERTVNDLSSSPNSSGFNFRQQSSESRVPSLPIYQLLVKKSFENELVREFPSLKTSQDATKNFVKFEGHANDVLSAKKKLKERLERLQKKRVRLPRYVVQFLCAQNVEGFANEHFLQRGVPVAFKIEGDQDIVLHGLSTNDLNKAEEILKDEIFMEGLTLDKDLKPYACTKEWNTFLIELLTEANKYDTKIQTHSEKMTNSDQNKIIIVGQKDTVLSSKRKVEEYLEQKSRVSEVIQVPSVELARSILDLLEFFGLQDLKVDIHSVANAPKLELKGSGCNVEKAKSAIKERTENMSHKTINICSPGAFTYFCGKGKDYFETIRAMFHCLPVLCKNPQGTGQLLTAALPFAGTKATRSEYSFHAGEKETILIVKNVALFLCCDTMIREESDVIMHALCKSSTVGVILNAAGITVKEELYSQGRRNGITVTGPGKLPTRIIIHFPCFCISNMTENLDKALAECKLRNFTSITVFIDKHDLHDHLDERLIADRLFGCLMKGVDEKQSEIRIITPQKEIYQSFKNKAEQMYGMRETDQEALHCHSELCEPAVIDIFGESTNLLERAKATLEKHYASFISNDQVVHPFINQMTLTEAIENLQKNLHVNLQIGNGSIKINGPVTKVEKAKEKVWALVNDAFQQKRKEKKTKLSTAIQWQYKDWDNYIALSTEDNYKLEFQYLNSQEPVTVHLERGDSLSIDFKEMKAVHSESRLAHQIRRHKTIANSLPGEWIDMTNKNYGKKLLDKDTMEYRWVEKLFNMSLSQMKIVKIERIQNTDVLERYLLRKNQIERKYRFGAPVENERYLFHGVTFDECSTIERNGFTRPPEGFFSFSCAYGQGVCFQMQARTALGKCTFDDNKCKCMFLARVLTGKYTIGKKRITAPPAMDPKKPEELYDSVVDNIRSPSLFMVFSEDCTYPDYLITFKE
ncbi:protein mono-ADP-ribosyltransferase PARP14-like isoform X2 [Polyodon spathula]|uniref:protein mono-ADP-ribosyltransferase PARP14-like isoform X2 n=1 Tax=Polyodon spathula TaxID=7913 RepID=UPI001B7EDDD6|nr:protein mono-ADP-ribosyltransferase PARP14-like isoform X2 [Polyodon spathula]